MAEHRPGFSRLMKSWHVGDTRFSQVRNEDSALKKIIASVSRVQSSIED